MLDQCRKVKAVHSLQIKEWLKEAISLCPMNGCWNLCVNFLGGCVVLQCSENILQKKVLSKNLFKSVSGFVLVIADILCI